MEHEAALINVSFEKRASDNTCCLMMKQGHVVCSSEEFVNTANHLRKVDPTSLDAGACEFLYVLASWELFVKMSHGRNRRVIDKLLSSAEHFGLIYPMLVAAMSSPKRMPDLLRSAVLDLIVTFYVDREPLQLVPPVHQTRVWPTAAKGVEKLQRIHLEDPWVKFEHLRPPEGMHDLKTIVVEYFNGPSRYSKLYHVLNI